MTSVNIYEAKTQLSRIIDRAAAGEDIVISRNGKPVARLCQLGPVTRTIEFGVLERSHRGSTRFRRSPSRGHSGRL